MSTPSIQTLITQAQQVLNLKSSNEIRATLAAILANANVGTPLNPNLTTQQLWDEFYEIVRQPSDDIMSIITDQMMRMVFSPPAPGGVGADKQVIFNDGGVLAGDPDLIFNKALNKLVANNIETTANLLVGTSATITGDLTVRTTGLIVNTDGVGIGVTPNAGLSLTLNGEFGMLANNLFYWNGYYSGGFKARAAGYSGNIYLNSSGDFLISNSPTSAAGAGSVASFYERYRINKNGEHTWEYVSNVAGTAMTLNSTGLGIGVAPVTGAKLAVAGPIVRNKGTNAIVQNIATTVATLPGEGLYIAYAFANASNPAAFTSYAVILCDSVGSRVIANNGTQITITTSTYALQVTQIFAATMNVNWSFVQIG
jgi:hypothetical protein